MPNLTKQIRYGADYDRGVRIILNYIAKQCKVTRQQLKMVRQKSKRPRRETRQVIMARKLAAYALRVLLGFSENDIIDAIGGWNGNINRWIHEMDKLYKQGKNAALIRATEEMRTLLSAADVQKHGQADAKKRGQK